MYSIVGLGNPGEKYQKNRHNIGFQFVDYIIENQQILNSKFQILNKNQISNVKDQNQNLKLKFEKSFNSEFLILNSKLVLVKPQTFMNKSGEAVKKLIENLKLKIENLIVVHDDLDIPLGKFKIQKGTGPQLHNGIESIENHLKTKDFLRIRIGVDARTPDTWIDGETYVLHDFLLSESTIIRSVFFSIIERLCEQKLLS